MKVGDIAIVTEKALGDWYGARVRITDPPETHKPNYGCEYISGHQAADSLLVGSFCWFYERELTPVSPLEQLAECAE